MARRRDRGPQPRRRAPLQRAPERDGLTQERVGRLLRFRCAVRRRLRPAPRAVVVAQAGARAPAGARRRARARALQPELERAGRPAAARRLPDRSGRRDPEAGERAVCVRAQQDLAEAQVRHPAGVRRRGLHRPHGREVRGRRPAARLSRERSPAICRQRRHRMELEDRTRAASPAGAARGRAAAVRRAGQARARIAPCEGQRALGQGGSRRRGVIHRVDPGRPRRSARASS